MNNKEQEFSPQSEQEIVIILPILTKELEELRLIQMQKSACIHVAAMHGWSWSRFVAICLTGSPGRCIRRGCTVHLPHSAHYATVPGTCLRLNLTLSLSLPLSKFPTCRALTSAHGLCTTSTPLLLLSISTLIHHSKYHKPQNTPASFGS